MLESRLSPQVIRVVVAFQEFDAPHGKHPALGRAPGTDLGTRHPAPGTFFIGRWRDRRPRSAHGHRRRR
jgi:hypothetical protein